ncbi:hypothetical protein RBB79_13710 [Tunturiibacter empetritectus]|uniref:Membrane protein YgcG n=1 Tax=Tunturiibacter lichenicola TaxID=2051959 RepID=A0A852VCQ7_9BACT|nr:hypothetical protein [Edaphobacter lichenicola]NYF90663.1 putative membrane protein YgcG [Edaphobacter lichenicola]
MSRIKPFAVSALAVALVSSVSAAPAQISVSIGAAPYCPYGYFDYSPYPCAPYGYYGPDWFTGGVFIGAGPWYHGHGGFYGHVDNRYDPRHGYAGPMPERNEQAFNHFHGNEAHDPQGHIGNAGHEPTNEHSAGFQGGGHPGGGGSHGGGGHH